MIGILAARQSCPRYKIDAIGLVKKPDVHADLSKVKENGMPSHSLRDGISPLLFSYRFNTNCTICYSLKEAGV